jgi:hypothetical protein
MKRFILKIILLASIATPVLACFVGAIYFIQSKASFKLPPDKHILIVGDSHTECAINEEIYSPAAVNISQSASAYIYSYCKIRKFLNENARIDTILLSFHRISSDDSWIFEEKHLIAKVPSHFTLFDKNDIAAFANNKMSFIKAVFHPVNRIALKYIIKRGDISYKDLNIGGYQKLNRDKLQADIDRHQKEADGKQPQGISLCQKEYLLKIVDLCKSRGVELILINPPTYKPELYGDIDKVNDYLNTYLPGVTYLDYSAFPLPNECYGDIGHLNYKGAEIFSTHLRDFFGQ